MEYFSHSRLKTLETCPRQYEYRYVKKEPEAFTSVEAFLGSRVHECLAWLYQSRMEGTSPPQDQAVERFLAFYDGKLSPRIKVIKSDDSIEARRAAGVAMIERFHETVFRLDRSETLALESKIRLELDEEVGYLGILDRVARSAEGLLRIVDFKTGKRVPDELDDATAQQLRSYGWLYMEQHPDDRVELRYRYLINGRKLGETMGREDGAEIAESIRGQIARARSCTAFPPKTSALCRWCGYRDVCDVSGFCEGAVPLCPTCGKTLRKRKGRFGDFYGCSGYPKCRFTRNA